MNLKYFCFLTFTLLPLLILSCSSDNNPPPMFTSLSPDETGITFENRIQVTDSINIQNDAFLYNGAGVGIGDINNDGLPDIFFAGNLVSSGLYLNKGDMQFDDITESAGLNTEKWITGVSMVDINNDGYLDIYLSVSGSEATSPGDRANLLFINNGDETFDEAGADYNINDTGFTTHAVFFDYDKDGHLDLYLLGNSPGEFRRGESGNRMIGVQNANPYGLDRLYRNNGNGTFTNVSDEAGISNKLGYGLGVAVADLNNDDWPDIYISNDITPNDVLYINNRDGTFTNRASDWLRHTSFAGMGMDIADFTNNGWLDIMQTDMMPEDISARKRMSGSTTYSGFMDLRRAGYFPHYNQNTLQLNNGLDDEGNVVLSEISRMAGVAYTDWSWTALFADYDNDGWKDLLVTNGYPKALNDFDYQSDSHRARQRGNTGEAQKREKEIIDNLHGYRVPNYIFKNNGNLTFTDVSRNWGFNYTGYSYGAAYADLNNNGRLDLIVNNINQPALVYENRGFENETRNYLQIKLEGEKPNTRGIGSKIFVYTEEKTQYIYHIPSRGFMSTMDDRIHFGLGSETSIDSLAIIWPDGRAQRLKDIEANQIVILDQSEADKPTDSVKFNESFSEPLFIEVSDSLLPDYVHRETSAVDFGVQSSLPYQISKQGPPIATGDFTGDGLDDLYIGGDRGTAGLLYIQESDGSFVKSEYQQAFVNDSEYEDTDALFFDANGNGLLDLYVTSGGYQVSPVSELLQDRLYINYGEGRFLRDNQALPQMTTSTSAVAAGDFTGDGQTDLFIGGRLTPRKYPFPARSWLLENNGGRFTDITEKAAPSFIDPAGMITDAVWADFDKDGQIDLVTVGEWMPVQFYKNSNGTLQDVTESLELPDSYGWWNSIETSDFNNNGYPDFAAGNLGLNHTYTATADEPFGVYAKDFDQNGVTEIILTKTISGEEYPFHGLAYLGQEIYTLGTRFDSFESFSRATITDIFSSAELDGALRKETDTFASIYLLNNGDGTFDYKEMPSEAQISPIQTIAADDFDSDGHTDLIIAGNLYDTEPNIPRADAGNGLFLKGNAEGDFIPIPLRVSGLLAPGNVRSSAIINTPDGLALVMTNNKGPLQFYLINQQINIK